MDDHDLVMKHEMQLNGSDGIANRVVEMESWKNNYLQSERKETCHGCDALENHITEEKKREADMVELSKVKINSGTLILVALIAAVPGTIGIILQIAGK